ncbi:MAG: methyltransferase domain-containing protein [Draconibacterium sp.]|nr:methyltransferase domain-containing protein [Draconibacterium sp.]
MKTLISKNILLLFIILASINQQLIAQNTPTLKYGQSQGNWNNTLKQDWFNLEPNKLLVETIEGINPGKALDVATGEGRNVIYLAQKGWNVTGFDIDNKALKSIQKRAKKMNLKITTVDSSRDNFDFGIYKWDLVVLCYVDVICGGCIANDDFIPTVAASIKKGGLVVYEMGHRDFYLENWENPGSWGCTEEQLIQTFTRAGFEILRCEAVTELGDWGSNKPGKRLKFVARKL